MRCAPAAALLACLAVGLYLDRDRADYDDTAALYSVVFGCTPRGECTPGVFFVPSGRATLLRCLPSHGTCELGPYLDWSPDDGRGFVWPDGKAPTGLR